ASDDPGGAGGLGSEDLTMHVDGVDSEGGDRSGEVHHEGRWPAEVDVRGSGQSEVTEQLAGHPAGRRVVHALLVGRAGLAEADVGPGIGKLPEQFSGLAGEGVMEPVPRRVQPPHPTGDRAATSAWSIDNSGVAPMPADNKTIGPRSSSRTNVPLGAATSSVVPSATFV